MFGQFPKNKSNQAGFSLVEAVIAIAIITIILMSLVAVFQTMTIFEKKTLKTRQATLLADQTIEVVKSLRDDSWSNISGLTASRNYFLSFNGSDWATSTATSTVDGFTRYFTVQTAYRDGSGKIASSGTADDSTKLVTASVVWSYAGATSTIATKTYLTDLFSQ